MALAPEPTIASPTAERPRYQPVAFLGPPFEIAVARVRVIERFHDFSSIQPTDFITSPERVARLWAQQRLRATGGEGEVQFVIEKVGAQSVTVDDVERITAVLEAHVVIDRGNGGGSGKVAVLLGSETTIKGPVTVEDRQDIYHQISRDIASKLDEKLTEAVRTKLGDFLEPSGARVAAARPTPPMPARTPALPVRQPVAATPTSPARVTIEPRPAWTETAQSTPDRASPLVGADGKLPPEAWQRGWNWKPVE